MTAPFTVLFFLSALSGCYGQSRQFQWLAGTWKIPGKEIFETWRAVEGSENLLGRSFRVKDADTIVTETISLEYHNGSYHYIPDVAGDQGPVDFKIIRKDGKSFVAENPQHDFPKIIRYRLVRKDDRDVLEAQIEGNGKVTAYTFEKIK